MSRGCAQKEGQVAHAYLATVEYSGKAYCGWQRQSSQKSVQGELERALTALFGEETAAAASGRTDAGVHAVGQAVSFEARTKIPAKKLPYALNALLPQDIRVRACREMPDGFHARIGAKRKTYLYKAYVSSIPSALRADFFAQITPPFNLKKAKTAAALLVGTHDFAAFCSTGGEVKSTVRTVFSASVKKRGDEVFIEVCGNGFLYNMVRIIAGTLIEIAQGRLPEDAISKMLASKERALGGKTYPPQGLYLLEVEY